MTYSTSRALPMVLLIWLAGLTAAGQFAKIAIPFETLSALYPGYEGKLGWMLTLVSGLGAVFGMTAGVFVTRIGPKRALIGALVLGAGCSAFQATIPDFTLMLISRFVEGASHLAMVVAAPTLIAQISPESLRGTALSLWSTFFGVAFALTAWLGPPLVAEHGLWMLFMGHGVIMLALVPVFAVLLPRIELPEAPSQSIVARHVEAYRSPSISAPALGWLFYTLTFVSLLVVLPGLLAEENRALIVSLMPLASIAVAMGVVPLMLARMSAVATIQLGYVLGILVLGGMLVGLPLGVSAVVLFAVIGLVQGASFAAVPELNMDLADRARANGAIAQMGNIGNLLGTPVLLGVLGVAGESGVLISVAAFYAMAIIVHALLGRLRAKAR